MRWLLENHNGTASWVRRFHVVGRGNQPLIKIKTSDQAELTFTTG